MKLDYQIRDEKLEKYQYIKVYKSIFPQIT